MIRALGYPALLGAILLPSSAIGQEVVLTRAGSRFALRAVEARVADIALKLSSATGVSIQVHPKLQDRTLTINLAARPPDRILYSLARRLGATADVVFCFKPRKVDDQPERPWTFAPETVSLPAPLKMRLEEALREINVAARVDDEVDRDVRLFSPGLPLYRVLDNLAAQVGASWTVEAGIEARTRREVEPESFERMQRHFSDLARFPSSERQEEIEWDLRRALGGPDTARSLSEIAIDIRGVATLYERFPGEHRGQVAQTFLGITRDYAAVIQRNESSDERLTPLMKAAREAQSRLALAR